MMIEDHTHMMTDECVNCGEDFDAALRCECDGCGVEDLCPACSAPDAHECSRLFVEVDS